MFAFFLICSPGFGCCKWVCAKMTCVELHHVGGQPGTKLGSLRKLASLALIVCTCTVYLRVLSVFWHVDKRNTPLRCLVEFNSWGGIALHKRQCYDVLACTNVTPMHVTHSKRTRCVFSQRVCISRSPNQRIPRKLAILRAKSTSVQGNGCHRHTVKGCGWEFAQCQRGLFIEASWSVGTVSLYNKSVTFFTHLTPTLPPRHRSHIFRIFSYPHPLCHVTDSWNGS